MDNQQKRQLDKLIQENNVIDNTENIRSEAKSKKIRDCVIHIQKTKQAFNFTKDFKLLDKECMKHSSYLFLNFPNIYNKLLRNQIDVEILFRFLYELSEIENGNKNQHEASFEIGKLLKEMYIDKEMEDIDQFPMKQSQLNNKNISYSEYMKKNA